MLDSFVSKGFPYDPDMFTSGSKSHGCGYAVRTVYQGWRSTAAVYVTEDNQRENLTIKTGTLVDKIVLEKGSSAEIPRATGVETLSPDGVRKTFFAKKEVIISGGSYCSPAILLRSGIGPKNDLETHGISCNIDLPGVGRNLMDHLVSLALYFEAQFSNSLPVSRWFGCSMKRGRGKINE